MNIITSRKSNCVLCNIEISSVDVENVNSFSGSGSIEDRRLFCKIFNVSYPSFTLENDFLSKILTPFCQFCCKNVDELCFVAKQIDQLKIKIDQLQIKIANCVVNSFASTSCHQKGYLLKRQIYESWFERCHHVPSSNIWESTQPSGPEAVEVSTPTGEESNTFNLKLVPLNQLVTEKSGNDSDNCSTTENFAPSPVHDESNDSSDIEVVYEPDNPVIPVPCVIKKVKKSHNKIKKKKSKSKSHNREKRHNLKKKHKTDSKVEDKHSFEITVEKNNTEVSELPKAASKDRSPLLKDAPLANQPAIRTDITNTPSASQSIQTDVPNNQQTKFGPRKMTNGRLKCTFCGKQFTLKCNFDVHIRAHTGEKPHKCKICGRGFNQAGNKAKHETTHDTTRFQGEPQFKCADCNKAFHLKDTLFYHRRKKHAEGDTPKCFESSPCQLCGAVMGSPFDLKMHMKRVHTVSEKKPIKCPICHITFSDEIYMKFHQSKHTSEILAFQCKVCLFGFKRRHKLNEHLKKIHKIEDCNANINVELMANCVEKVIRRTGNDRIATKPLGRPRRKDPERFKCKICGKYSKSLSAYDVHARTHSGEKPHKCKYCDKTFNDAGNRKVHEDAHEEGRYEGEPKYECKECGKKYFIRRSLYTHRSKYHSKISKIAQKRRERLLTPKEPKIRQRRLKKRKIRPYQCTDCSKGFTTEYLLKVHELDHPKEGELYKCAHCPMMSLKAFSKESLQTHYRKSHSKVARDEIPLRKYYKCPKCPRKYSYKYRVMKHIGKAHERPEGSSAKTSNKKIISHSKGLTSTKRKREFSDSSDKSSDEELLENQNADELILVKKERYINNSENKNELVRKGGNLYNTRKRTALKKIEQDTTGDKSGQNKIVKVFEKELKIILHRIDEVVSHGCETIDIKEETIEF